MTDILGVLPSLLEHTRLFPGEDLLFSIFLNPASGVFRDESRRSEFLRALEALSELTISPVGRERIVLTEIHPAGSREECLQSLEEGIGRILKFQEKTEDGPRRRSIVVTAGGDGFHKDCLTWLALNNPDSLEKLIICRLPLGTGNDTPLLTDPVEVVKLLGTEGFVRDDSLIQVETAGGDVDYALNVVSFGLDAFVCLLTEKWKGRVKGDIYKIMVDLSTLFYDFYHRTRISRITLYPEGGGATAPPPVQLEKRVLINVFGRGGNTNYGGGKRILPGPENHLITGMFRLPGRIMLKGLFMKGGHWPGRSRVDFFHTRKMVLSYPAPLLMELDGELTRLEKKDFPVTVTKLSRRLKVLN